MRDFTLAKYQALLQALIERGFPILGVAHWMDALPTPGALLRHDVDRRPFNAVRMAGLEHRLGIASTYYFRADPCSYVPECIKRIRDWGHEIGYHYEDLARTNGNTSKALDAFFENLEKLREHAPVRTVSAHGSPLSPHDNQNLWLAIAKCQKTATKYRDAVADIDYRDMLYFTDTGRTWDSSSANLRDHAHGSLAPDKKIRNTSDLCNFIQNHRPARLALTVHPERWDEKPIDWLLQWGKDQTINTMKRGIKALRAGDS
ncbi:MAG: polysaccharide deacetylase family protein [Candidatus Eutrophobiaceae bacterium]